MGQQQLLLIILGVIVVGIAVAVGITMFTDNAVNANRDAVTNDLVNLAARAQQYYRRPTALGGGGNSFVGLTADAAGLTKLTNRASNANGSIHDHDCRFGNRCCDSGCWHRASRCHSNNVKMQIFVSSLKADSVAIIN